MSNTPLQSFGVSQDWESASRYVVLPSSLPSICGMIHATVSFFSVTGVYKTKCPLNTLSMCALYS